MNFETTPHNIYLFRSTREGQVGLKVPLMLLHDEHITLRLQLDSIYELANRIERAPLDRRKEWLDKLTRLMVEFEAKSLCHLSKEEELLFPLLVRYMSRENSPIAVLEYEHDHAKQNIRRYYEIINGLSTPINTSAINEIVGYVTEAVVILMDHFRKEEQVLFPIANSLFTQAEMEWLQDEFERMDGWMGSAF
ncbi:hemerythrin domain-containing protein [Paenibacillus soyae]|uniref:Hemerythrin domain-containing protein n=1 Tax=Paenibacillus soyae TaxID=2969249 RepID=A0A9X2MQR4_9BACL|nr:hemerythrin domain-containing protein [Paenibacillus soyae]MCR2804061.1 hemerythrin domain-containing protein [Paenibacillus soyae]